MDARERWQAPRARLTAARAAAVDAGDRAAVLAEVTRAATSHRGRVVVAAVFIAALLGAS